MHDDDILAMQFKVLCTSMNWGLEDGILFGTKTNMANVCYWMRSQSLAHPTYEEWMEIIKGIS